MRAVVARHIRGHGQERSDVSPEILPVAPARCCLDDPHRRGAALGGGEAPSGCLDLGRRDRRGGPGDPDHVLAAAVPPRPVVVVGTKGGQP